ncbi:MAG TPA: CHASE3 domain-containing protein [Gemmatimonadales bacterium]|nr:CHASE3 domain-containing protein [Gemmatimonadales bacterium]
MQPTRPSHDQAPIVPKPGLNERVTAAFSLAVGLLLAVGIMTFWGFSQINGAREVRQHSVTVRDGVTRLLVHLQDAETGQRGFLLTGRDPYLRPFQTGSQQVRGDLDTLVQVTAPDTDLSPAIRALTPAIEAKLSELTATVDLRRSKGLGAALAVVQTDRGRLLMDSVRQLIRGIGRTEVDRYASADSVVARTTALVEKASAVGTVLAIGFLVIAGVVAKRDASSRVTIETQLEEVSDEMNDLYQNAPCGYHTVDLEGLVVRMNRTECRWLGYQLDEVVGKKNLFDLLAPEDRPRARARFDRLVAGEDIGTGEARFVRKDGTRIAMMVSSVLVRDVSGAPSRVRATMLDQTEFRGARDMVNRLNAALQRHVAELEDVNGELERFSYTVSHDLRAPLRAIAGFASLLTQEHASRLDAEGLRLLDVIHVNTERMGRLIDDLLSLTRLSRVPLVRSSVAMTTLVAGVVADRKAAGVDGGVAISIGDLPDAQADRALLKHVWERLIDNAVKFTTGAEGPRIEIGAQSDNGNTVYTVRDNGIGLDMQYAEKVFEVFQRLHPQSEYEGTGVGLAVVQRVVHRHGGRVWVESASGRGATFFFTLDAKGGA